jgi:hypothetical protein
MRKGAGTVGTKWMAQKIVFWITNSLAEILWHVLGYRFCVELHILALSCQMLLPSKVLKYICTKAGLLFAPKMLVKLALSVNLCWDLDFDSWCHDLVLKAPSWGWVSTLSLFGAMTSQVASSWSQALAICHSLKWFLIKPELKLVNFWVCFGSQPRSHSGVPTCHAWTRACTSRPLA